MAPTHRDLLSQMVEWATIIVGQMKGTQFESLLGMPDLIPHVDETKHEAARGRFFQPVLRPLSRSNFCYLH